MRFLRYLASITGAVGFFTGCTALLGTFEVGGSGPDAAAIDGAGTDGPVNGESGSDGATDGPAAPLLTCGVDKGNIRRLDTARPRSGQPVGGQLSFDSPHVFHIGPNKTRVVARPSQSQGFTIYEFDPKNGNGQTNMLDIVTSGRIYDVQRTDDSIQVLAVGTGADAGRLQVHRIADATFTDAVIPLTPINAVDESSPAGTRGPAGAFALLNIAGTTPDYFWTFSTPKAADGPFDLAIGRSTALAANPQKIVFTSNDPMNPASPRVLLAAGGEIFMPLQQDSNGPPTTTDSIIHTPDSAQAQLQAVPRSMGKPGGKPNIFFAAGRSVANPGAYNMAFIEVDTASATAPLTFRLGAVKDSILGTFVVQDIPASFSFDSVTRLPSDGGDTRWLGDHFVATGKGQGVPGVNFIWYDTANKALRANQTGPDTLLKDRTDVHRSSMTFGGPPTAIFTDFELVWTEAATFDGEVSENLFYAPVSCLK